ncbi:MAG TPA: nucleotidyltransferase family protein [Terriglobales bacterium]|nr:nucleotidyltransferase family protein [Terriglobales bacterium]
MPLPQPAPSRAPSAIAPCAITFSAELDLILACCGEDSDGRLSAKIRQILRHGVNWERLVQLADRHGLVPLVFRRLSADMDAGQSHGLEALRQLDKANAHRTLWLTLELFNIHRHLQARGLEVLPYKGPLLADGLYGNVALRQFSDLDLLVRSDDLPAIKQALAELGYEPGLRLAQAAERDYLKSGYEYTFDGARGRNLLEIKWQILPRFYSIGFDVNEFFERAAVVTIEGRKLRTLCEHDLMLVLCAHAAKHAWKQVSWLCDIVQLARSQGLDWAELQAEAERLGIMRIVTVSFLLAHQLLGAALPAQLRREIEKDAEAEILVERVLRLIVAEEEFDPESMAYFRLMMELRERRRDRAAFWWRLLFTPGAGEWAMVRLPGPLFPLYRAVRIYRLAERLVSPRSA